MANLRRAPWENINPEQRKLYKQEMEHVTLMRRGSTAMPKTGTNYDPWGKQKAAMNTRERAKQNTRPELKMETCLQQ